MKLSAPAKVGLFVLVGLITLGAIITWKSDIFLRTSGYTLTTSFNSIEGLTIGSDVRYRGFVVGKVMQIDPGPEDIKIFSVIERNIHFPMDSRVRVSYDGIVGLKYLEIVPGKNIEQYRPGMVIMGKGTSAIVDFIDIGTKNLEDIKKILVAFRKIIEDPSVQTALVDTIANVQKISAEIRTVTAYLAGTEFRSSFRGAVSDLRDATRQMDQLMTSINGIVSDPNFQTNLKGTIGETNTTLASANNFFKGVSRIQALPSVDVRIGSRANEFRANLDFLTTPDDFLRMNMGEAVGGSLTILDFEIGHRFDPKRTLRLGMIGNKLGVGIDYQATPKVKLIGDVFDFNKAGAPRVRIASEYKWTELVDLTAQGDDMFGGNPNYSIGVKVGSTAF